MADKKIKAVMCEAEGCFKMVRVSTGEKYCALHREKQQQAGFTLVEMLIVLGMLTVGIALLAGGVTDPDAARMILARDGMTKIEMTGYVFLGCSKDDWYHTGFRAVKNGQPVNGVVCAGFFKGSTIRYLN